METKTAGMEEVRRLYEGAKNVLAQIELIEKEKNEDYSCLKDYQYGRIDAIEDIVKALGLYDEMMGIRKPTEEDEDDGYDDYWACKGEQALSNSLGPYEIHD